jgi:predicted flavoprotein YhiN
MRALSGLSAEVEASCNGVVFRENLLFTHRGLSGPAILQVSSCWREGDALSIDLLPGLDAAASLRARKRERPRAALKTILGEMLPQRLAQALAPDALRDRPVAELADRDLDMLGEALDAWRVVPAGSEGYAKAEVTLGGARGPGPLRDRRGRGRHRLAGRLQFPVGLVERLVRRPGPVSPAQRRA